MNLPKHILCLCDYNPSFGTTGYSRVSENILPAIKAHFGNDIQLHICAINYIPKRLENGQIDESTLCYYENDSPLEAYPTKVFSAMHYKEALLPNSKSHFTQDGDKFGRFEFCQQIQDGEFDGFFIMQDISCIVSMLPVLKIVLDQRKKDVRKMPKGIFYFPIDTPHIDSFKHLELFDLLITYTEFGRNMLLANRPDLQSKIRVVPHGINAHEFFPMHDDAIMDFREQYYGAENANRFIIGNINRNTLRKNMPDTLLAFVELKRLLKSYNHQFAEPMNPLLYLHCHPQDPLGFDLYKLCHQLGLKEGEDFMLAPLGEDGTLNHITTADLNDIYNSLNVYISTATGGGWELTVMEAMAARVPCIIPKHSSFAEIGDGNRAIFLEELLPFCNHAEESTIRQRILPEELAEKIIDLYQQIQTKGQWQEQVFTAAAWANKLSWSSINKRWIGYWKEVFM